MLAACRLAHQRVGAACTARGARGRASIIIHTGALANPRAAIAPADDPDNATTQRVLPGRSGSAARYEKRRAVPDRAAMHV